MVYFQKIWRDKSFYRQSLLIRIFYVAKILVQNSLQKNQNELKNRLIFK